MHQIQVEEVERRWEDRLAWEEETKDREVGRAGRREEGVSQMGRRPLGLELRKDLPASCLAKESAYH